MTQTEYRVKPLRPLTFWERGLVRYCILSYSLWLRQILIDYELLDPKWKKIKEKR